LVEENDTIGGRVVKSSVVSRATAARATVNDHNWLSFRVSALLVVDFMGDAIGAGRHAKVAYSEIQYMS
jgi:hypothetical protein